MSTVPVAAESNLLGSLRDLVRRILTLGSRRARGPRMFDHARNTDIQYANFIINQGGDIMLGSPPPATTHPVAAEQRASENTTDPSQTRERDPPRPLRNASKVYVDCLLNKGHGYPLWIPSPNLSLPKSNRVLGVSVGDVGVLTPKGGFDFLFNIFHDATHPINAAVGVPDAFVPFTPAPAAADIQHFVELNAGSFLTDSSIIKLDNGGDRSTTIFEATRTEGAVLMAPEDVHATTLKITTRLRKYVEENIVMWYKYVKHTLGHDIENGDLLVIYGCRKSTGFGIATAFNPGQQENTRLSFFVEGVQEDPSRCPYRWDHTGSAETKAGSSIQSNVEFSSTQPNQCLFVETINTRLSAEIWNSADLDTVMYGTRSPDLREPNHGKHRPTGNSSTSGSGSTSFSSLTPSREHVFHPSVILHSILEAVTSGPSACIVCDDDWAPFISDTAMNARNFIDRLLESRIIVEDQGMLFFCTDSDIDLLDELDQRRMVRIGFSHINDSSDTSYSYWKAERRISSESCKTQGANPPIQGGLDAIADHYSDTSSVTTAALIGRDQEEAKKIKGRNTNIKKASSSSQFIDGGTDSTQNILTRTGTPPLADPFLLATPAPVAGHGFMFNSAGGDLHINNAAFVVQYSVDPAPSLDPIRLYRNVAPSAIFNAAERADAARCCAGTREETISHIDKWRTDAQANIIARKFFCLSGPAGAGKTAIMQAVAEHWKVIGVQFATFFCSGEQNLAMSLVPTLLYQIFAFYPAARVAVERILASTPRILEASIKDQFDKLMYSSLRSIGAHFSQSIILLIDGLDECDSKKAHQRQILQALYTLVSDSDLPFLVLVSGRSEPQIVSALKGSSEVDSLFLDNQYSVEDDIRLFITKKFKEIKATRHAAHSMPQNWPSASDLDTIATSSRQFIYAATVMRFIAASSEHPVRSLAIVMGLRTASSNSPFAQLDTLYAYILAYVSDPEKLRVILHAHFWLLQRGHFVKSNLTLQEVLSAYDERYTDFIIQSCIADVSAILRLDNGKLIFYHACLEDYLLDQSRSGIFFINTHAFNFKILRRLLEMAEQNENGQHK